MELGPALPARCSCFSFYVIGPRRPRYLRATCVLTAAVKAGPVAVTIYAPPAYLVNLSSLPRY